MKLRGDTNGLIPRELILNAIENRGGKLETERKEIERKREKEGKHE